MIDSGVDGGGVVVAITVAAAAVASFPFVFLLLAMRASWHELSASLRAGY